jgi:hypothetical protein
MKRSLKPGQPVYHQRLGRGVVVEEWGAWVDVDDRGNQLAVNGKGIPRPTLSTPHRPLWNICDRLSTGRPSLLAVEDNGEAATVPENESQEASRTAEPTQEAGPSGGETEPGGVPAFQPGTDEADKGTRPQEETRRPAEQLSDADRQQIVGRVGSALAVAIDKFRPLFDAPGDAFIRWARRSLPPDELAQRKIPRAH